LSNGHGSVTTSPIYGVGVWETAVTTTTTSGGGGGSASPISSDDQVNIIANNVYGIDAGSFDELNHKYIQITRRDKKGRRN
jgi:hypothetical protein